MRELLRRLRTLLSNRLVILGLIFSMILYLLWSNLFHLQVLDPKTYAQMETPTYVNTLKTDGTRGEIYDRYGRPLAYNEYTWSLYYDSSQTPEDLNGLCHRMAPGTPGTPGFFYAFHCDCLQPVPRFLLPGGLSGLCGAQAFISCGDLQQIQYPADGGREDYDGGKRISVHEGRAVSN